MENHIQAISRDVFVKEWHRIEKASQQPLTIEVKCHNRNVAVWNKAGDLPKDSVRCKECGGWVVKYGRIE